jgi:hypothetical protein
MERITGYTSSSRVGLVFRVALSFAARLNSQLWRLNG